MTYGSNVLLDGLWEDMAERSMFNKNLLRQKACTICQFDNFIDKVIIM